MKRLGMLAALALLTGCGAKVEAGWWTIVVGLIIGNLVYDIIKHMIVGGRDDSDADDKPKAAPTAWQRSVFEALDGALAEATDESPSVGVTAKIEALRSANLADILSSAKAAEDYRDALCAVHEDGSGVSLFNGYIDTAYDLADALLLSVEWHARAGSICASVGADAKTPRDSSQPPQRPSGSVLKPATA